MADPRNFLLNTDYPLDKIVFTKTGTITAAAGASITEATSHGLSFTPLPVGQWSTSSDFSVVYDEETGPIVPNSFSPYATDISVYASTTGVSVTLRNYSGSAVTAYYRVFCFMPSDVDADAPHTSTNGQNMQLSTDYNYTKLLLSGYQELPDTTGGSYSLVIPHNLGYRPQIMIWREDLDFGDVFRLLQAAPNIDGINGLVDTSNVIIKSSLSLAAGVHWRIYADE